MEIPRELFYLSAFFFAVMAVVAFFRAYREKERVYYTGGGLCLLGLAWSILFVLDQVPLAGLFWVVAMIVSIVMLPELTAFQDRRMREVDIESPLRVGEFFSNTYSGWLKLAYRHGLGTTVILYALQHVVIGGGLLLALNLFYDFPSGLILIILTSGIFLVIRFYRQIKRALTTIHPPSGSPTEK
ncbi:MAG TPA: hypothetical protein VMW03_04670 [Candidatus Krumholzibacteriaceae bacterium]|nr:hypothetical protein [Candidatus Krumholzibacteriaceae bacterium]